MNNRKTTKRALWSSVVSLLLCFAMLMGATYAWFTDSVTSANNIIKSGNLDIKLEYWNGTEWVDVEGKSDILTNELWEPGVTEVAYFRIANAGSLALKYQFGINIVSEIAGKNVAGEDLWLSDYIQFGVVELDTFATYETREAAIADVAESKEISVGFTKAETMLSGEETYLALVVYMPTTVGNEANHDGTNVPEINLGINIFATQAEYEEDGFGTDYDADAWMPEMQVYTAEDLQAAVTNAEPGTEIVLQNDIVLDESIVIPATPATYSLHSTPVVTLDLNGKNIIIETAYSDAQSTASSAIVNYGSVVLTGDGSVKATNNYTIRNYGTMIIDGLTVENGIMNFADLTVESGNISNGRSGKHVIYGNAAKLTINGGSFYNGNAGNATVFAYAGEVVINGGEFSIADGTATFGWTSCLLDAQGGAQYTINGGVINGEIRDYNNNTTIYGGTFSAKPNANFIADGFKAVVVDGVYYVVPEGTTLVTDAASLKDALATGGNIVLLADVAIANNETITIANGTTAVIDLNGYEITSTADKTGNQELFLVKGNLTVKNGSMSYTASNNQGWGAMIAIFDVTAGGVLTMDNVTASVGGSDMNFIVHLNNWGSATLNVTDCDFTTTYVAIRAFNSGFDMNNIVVENTAFHGGRVFWVHNYTSEGKDATTLNVDIYGNGNTTDNAKPIRYGFSVSEYYTIDGVQLVGTADELAAALAAGKSVALANDITVVVADTGFEVGTGINAKLDLNGYNITATSTSAESVQLFYVEGNLEIVGKGTISLTNDNYNWSDSYRYTAINIREAGVVTLGEGVSVVCETYGDVKNGMCYAVDIYHEGVLNVNGASLHSNYIAVRCFFGASVVNVNSGSSITSSKNNWGIWPQSATGAQITIADGIAYTTDSYGIYIFG